MVCRHKSKLFLCGNEETDYQEDIFTPVVYLTVGNFIICLSLQQNLKSKLLDFQNAVQNRHFDRTVYAEQPKYINHNLERTEKVWKLKRSL